MTRPACPECQEDRHVYWSGSWCAHCGWHAPHQTLAHANYQPDPSCAWCRNHLIEPRRTA